MSGADRHRRRRNSRGVPALIRPADIPADADGRVEFIAVHVADDAPPAASEPVEPAAEAVPGTPETSAEPADRQNRRGWAAVAILGVALIAVFVIGMLLTR